MGLSLRCLVVLLAAVVLHSVGAVQTRDVKAKAQPDQVVAGPADTAAFNLVAQEMTMLSKRVEVERANIVAALQRQKVAYDLNVTQLAQQRLRKERRMKNLTAELAELNRSCDVLKARSEALVAGNEELRADLLDLDSNITSAQDFAQTVLENNTYDAEVHSGVMDVLAELDASDKKREEALAIEKAMEEIVHERKGSMLQVSADKSQSQWPWSYFLNSRLGNANAGQAASAAVAATDPRSALAAVNATLMEMAKDKTSRLKVLEEEFENETAKEQKMISRLSTINAGLNATRKSVVERKHELIMAVKRLEATQKDLASRRDQLLSYVGQTSGLPATKAPEAAHQKLRLGKTSQSVASAKSKDQASKSNAHKHTEGLALLQVKAASQASMDLPGAEIAAKEHARIFHSLSSNVIELSQRIAEVRSTHNKLLATMRAKFMANLTMLNATNDLQANQNRMVRNQSQATKSSNFALRQAAADLQTTNAALRGELRELQLNMTSAVDFAEEAVSALARKNTSELEIVTVLQGQEADRNAKKAHEDLLAAISPDLPHDTSAPFSFLQTKLNTQQWPKSMD